jgi:hypothetical protein
MGRFPHVLVMAACALLLVAGCKKDKPAEMPVEKEKSEESGSLINLQAGGASIKVGPGGVHVKTGDEEVKVGQEGVHVKTGDEEVKVDKEGVKAKSGHQVDEDE